MEIIRFQDIGHRHFGWLEANYHFSFGDYYDERRMGYGPLRVWNDDIIAPLQGFPMHPHRDMEIVTYIIKGTISHKDTKGHEGSTSAGNIQVMSAGTGIAHSEYNLENEEGRAFQIWFLPRNRNNRPRWENRSFPSQTSDKFTVVASGFSEHQPDAIYIDSDAALLAGNFAAGQTIEIDNNQRGRELGRYLVLDHGELELASGERLYGRDGLQYLPSDKVAFRCITPTRVVMAELFVD